MENIAEKKKAILESTLKLIKENGFHGTPMSLVAKNACCAAGTIYHYFESKEALIVELHAYVKSKFLDVLSKDDFPEMDFKERFINRWIRLCNFYILNPDILFFLEQFANSPFKDLDDITVDDRYNEIIISFYNNAIEKGIIRNINLGLIRLLVHSTIVATAKASLAGKIEIQEHEFRQMAEIMWAGLVNETK